MGQAFKVNALILANKRNSQSTTLLQYEHRKVAKEIYIYIYIYIQISVRVKIYYKYLLKL
jgi:hypothetical protein